MKKIKFCEADCRKIVDMYICGISIVDIGKFFNCSRTPIKKVLLENNINISNVKIKLKESNYQNIVDMYKDGKSGDDIATYYNCSKPVIYNILKKMNVELRPNGFTDDDASMMYELYKDGKRLQEIAKIYHADPHTIGKVLKRNNFEVDRKTYHCDEHYFDTIDTQEKAYVLGLLWADGYNNVKRGKVTIALQDRDKKLLEDINFLVGSDRPLWISKLHDKNENWRDSYVLTLQSRHMSDVLCSYGMVQRKSLVLEFPYWMDESLYSHFIRGYMDGDGSIYSNTKNNIFRVSFVGTNMLLSAIQGIGKKMNVKLTISKANQNKKVDQLTTTSIPGTIAFLNWIYKDATIKMERKYKKYQQFIEHYSINNSLVS